MTIFSNIQSIKGDIFYDIDLGDDSSENKKTGQLFANALPNVPVAQTTAAASPILRDLIPSNSAKINHLVVNKLPLALTPAIKPTIAVSYQRFSENPKLSSIPSDMTVLDLQDTEAQETPLTALQLLQESKSKPWEDCQDYTVGRTGLGRQPKEIDEPKERSCQIGTREKRAGVPRFTINGKEFPALRPAHKVYDTSSVVLQDSQAVIISGSTMAQPINIIIQMPPATQAVQLPAPTQTVQPPLPSQTVQPISSATTLTFAEVNCCKVQ